MTKRRVQPSPKEVTIKEDTEVRVTEFVLDTSTPLACGPAKLSRIGHARVIDVLTPDGMIRIVIR